MSKQHTIPEIILGFPKKDDDRLAAMKASAAALDGNADFPNIGPVLKLAKDAIAPYEKAIADAKAKVPGAVSVRREARIAAMKAWESVRLHVQSVADTKIDQAATLAVSARMKVAKVPQRTKADFAVKDGPVSAYAELVAKAVHGALLYFWEMSADGASWKVAGDSHVAHFLVAGLTVGQTYYFRFRTRNRTGTTDYSQVLTHVAR